MRTVEPRAIQDTAGDYWVGLTPQHYENLGKNMIEIFAHLQQRKLQVRYYRECIERHNEQDDAGSTERP